MSELGVKTGDGFQINVIPSYAKLGVDIRIPPYYTDTHFEEIYKNWINYPGVTHYFTYKSSIIPASNISNDNIWFTTFKDVCDRNNISLKTEIFPAATDSRFLRSKGICAFGFSPINNTKRLLHQHNEYLNKDTYLNGISIYVDLLKELGSLDK
jgi:aminoacylase